MATSGTAMTVAQSQRDGEVVPDCGPTRVAPALARFYGRALSRRLSSTPRTPVYCLCRCRNRLVVSRSAVELDEVGALLQAAGRGDFDAFASFYDRTAPGVFNHLHHVLGDTAAAERATVQVYVRVWRTAPTFDPAVMSGASFLVRACRPLSEDHLPA
jgi:hypothetical protein